MSATPRSDPRVLLKLARVAMPHLGTFAAVLALLVVNVIIEALVLPALFACLVVAVVGPARTAGQSPVIAVLGLDVTAMLGSVMGSGHPGGLLLGIAGAGIVAMVAKSACRAARGVLSYRFSFRVVGDLRALVLERLLNLSSDFFDTSKTGVLVSRLTADVNLVQLGLGPPLVEVVQAPLTIATAVLLLFVVSWPLTLVTLFLAPLVLWVISRASRMIRARTESRQRRLADLNGYVAERLGAVRVIQVFGRERHELGEMRALDGAYFREALRSVRVAEILEPATESVVAVGMLLGLVIGGVGVLNGTMTPEHFILFFAVAPTATTQLGRLARIGDTIQQLAGGAASLFSILDTRVSVVDAPAAHELARVRGHVRYEQVSFAYPNGRNVLTSIELEIEPGTTLAVVGPSGAGKTTLVNLLPRLFDPTEGRVVIDGQDVRSVTLASLRRNIGLVSQEAVLFNRTVADNIRYGRPDATDDEMRAAADAAHATEFIERLPDRWDTVIGERGTVLSGGQRQRLSIARALLRDPSILILDEATSALDSVNERLIQDAVQRLIARRTTIVIAHRLSTVHHASRILVLDGGRIAGLGTHAELIVGSVLYQKLHAAQLIR